MSAVTHMAAVLDAVQTALAKPKRVDPNPLREIVRTLELDCVVRYRVNLGVCDDELPNVYDIEIVGPADGTSLREVIRALEVELPVEEAEAESQRRADMAGDSPEYDPEDDEWQKKRRARAADAAEELLP